jgi:hypothetical protein
VPWPWLSSLLLFAGCGSGQPETERSVPVPVATIERNGAIAHGLPLRYEPFESPRLDELRLREELEAIVAGSTDEFGQMLLLKNWVAQQWPDGLPDPYPPWDAIVVLDWIRGGLTGGFCGQYAQVLLQSLAALGWTARYVEIGTNDNPYAHFVLEVWSNQFNKWILLDADYNVHFERDGVPMSALEIHDAVVASDMAGVVAVTGPRADGTPDLQVARWPLHTAELYYYLRVHLKANHLTMPDEPPFDRMNDMVEWEDALTVAWEDSEVISAWQKERPTNLRSSDRLVYAAPLNQVYLAVESVSTGEVVVNLENSVVQFQRYEWREITGPRRWVPSAWHDHRGAQLRWKLTSVIQTLEVRGVNARGVAGPASVITVRYTF